MPILRYAMGWTALLLVVVVAQGAPLIDASQRQRLAHWLRDDDALLVVLVFEGLRADALNTEDRGGAPLLPSMQALASVSLRYTDVLTGAPHVVAGAFELLAGVEARQFLARSPQAPPWPGGFTRLIERGFQPLVGGAPPDATLQAAFPWLFDDAVGDLDTFLTRLRELAGQPGPHLAVFFSSAPLPPYDLDDARLDATDPRPWADAAPSMTMEQLVVRRRATARAMAPILRTGEALGTRRHGEVFTWIAQAAAVAADEVVGRVTGALASAGLSSRSSVLVTSTLGTAVGDRGVVGAASGVGLGQVAVPLLWQLPGETRATPSAFPTQLQDVASTLVDLLEARGPESGADLLGPPPTQRERLAVAWFRRAGEAQAEFRITTDALTLRRGPDAVVGLYDRRWDPRELVNLAPRQSALVRDREVDLRNRLWGPSPQLWILVKGESDDLVSVVVRGRGLTAEGEELEPLDAVQAGADRITASFMADDADVVKIPLPSGFAPIVVEVQSPRGRSPLFLGPTAVASTSRSVRLGPFQPTTLQVWAGADPTPPVAWLADRRPGVTVWLVGG